MTLFSRMCTFVMLSRQLGPSGYGAFLGLYGILTPLGGLTYSGLRLGVLQRVILHRRSVRSIVRSYTALALIQGLLGVGASLLLAKVFLDGLSTWLILGYAATELLLAAAIDLSSAFVHAASTFAAGARIRTAAQVLRAVVVGVLFASGHLSLDSFCIALLLANVALAWFLFGWLLPQRGIVFGLARPGVADAQVSGHLSVTIFASSLMNDGDKTVLSAFNMNHDAGVYGAGYRVMQMAFVPAQSVQNALFDRFLKRGLVNPLGQMRDAVRYTWVMFVISAVVAGALVLGSNSLRFLLGSEFDESAEVLRWLALVPLVVTLSQGPANALAALDRLPLRTTLVTGTAALSVCLYVLLIPQFGWRGAALGTLLSEGAYAAAIWTALVVVHRKLPNPLQHQANSKLGQ